WRARNRTLKSILTKIADTTQFWNSQLRNEDTYLKYQLGPFLDTYFGKLRCSTKGYQATDHRRIVEKRDCKDT
ncbi:hypothetical protein BGX31_004942, partial [Mortierella sp. GBA43]